MKHFHYATLSLLVLCLACFSCQEDDNLPSKKPGPETGANVNRNSTTTNTNYGINFAVEWDCDKKAQRWTCYQMNTFTSHKGWSRDSWKATEWKGDPFQEDPDLPTQYRTTLADYKNSGYDRGHICPSADRLYSKDVNEQTYYLSNMQPQLNSFNTGVWLTMENQLRNKWNTNTYRDVLYVCKGGTIDKASQISTHTTSGLIVSKYFFTAILAVKDGQYHALGLWFEHKNNKDENLRTYAVSIDRLEQLTGIDFFCNLPDDTENTVEAKLDLSWWGL